MTRNSSLLAEDIDKRGEVYLGQKVPASHTNCMLNTVGVLITQINYFSYPTPCPEKNRSSKHWGTLKVSAQTLKPCVFARCTVIEAQKHLAVTRDSLTSVSGMVHIYVHVCYCTRVQREMLHVHLLSNRMCSVRAFCKIPPCLWNCEYFLWNASHKILPITLNRVNVFIAAILDFRWEKNIFSA